ncbi:ABC transporter permease [Aureimonas endophytica]|uniref:ABC transporter permease n=1 Tax=Aureimonas endophytica TaxID=2027858 RepID=A0A916ZHI0_9HYPH|nr:ABC transporter permease [Aureimonas endophytica]GGD98625.1 ABC transporter permease [Aureimonas endophytica]
MSTIAKFKPGVQTPVLPFWKSALLMPSVGPLVVLLLFCLFFAFTTEHFLTPRNLSLVMQQSVILGALAIGQTLVILTAGIDLAAGGITVLAMVIIGRFALEGLDPALCILLALAVAIVLGAVSGTLVSRLRLPPFIVTLGLLGIVTAATRLLSMGNSYPIENDLAAFFGNGFTLSGARVTYGMLALLGLYAAVAFALHETWWGRHVYAVGNSPAAARLVGINVPRILLSVYVVAGLIYAFAAWLALGRIPSADPNALQTANLDSITAAVIGGASLFGGRGGVIGTLIGTLIIAVLRNGLTLRGIDPLWQDLVTGVLVILAVAADQLYRRRW